MEGLIAFEHPEEEHYLHTFIFSIRRDTGTALAEFVDYCRDSPWIWASRRRMWRP